MRLDLYLFENGLALSRNKASEMIKNREVFVDQVIITKPSFKVEEKMSVKIQESYQYVSRAALKLKGFFQNFQDLCVKNKDCLDIGSSTGGFVEVLLEFGAKIVTAVDVGNNQLHISLRNNPKIELYEKTDVRNFQSDSKFDIVTCDVSFIGVEQILQDINRLSSDIIVILFKPQFEVGKDVKRTKKGVLKDSSAIQRVMDKFETQTFSLGWKLLKKEESIVKGKEGNAEIFYCFSKR